MSHIVRRGLSTLIPPKIASPSGIGAAKDAARMERIVDFYAKLPRGAAPEVKPFGLWGKYQARYFQGKNQSFTPIIHLIAGICLMGYGMEYYFHLPLLTLATPLLLLLSNFICLDQNDILIPKPPGLLTGLPRFFLSITAVHSLGLIPSHKGVSIYRPFPLLTAPSIVMAEQSSHDVVNQTRSGGELSPSDVPASKPDNITAGGDAEGVKPNTNTETETKQSMHTTQAAGGTLGVNGSNAVSNARDDAISISNAGDASGGSDTDTSRADTRGSTDESQHARTNSVKRPTSFKPVSFAKFSVAKSPGSMQASKAAPFSSSPSSTTSPSLSSRPRLVAKTGSSLRDSALKSTTRGGKSGSAGPDPNQVWNKNRPVQQTPSKHLTDEELKQQYGIHMTSRIQEDGDGKESKWADIDDDEDDWAPETIEWNDGTKIMLTQPEPVSTSIPETKDIKDMKEPSPPADSLVPRESSKVLVSKSSGSLGPNATILKLGASAEKQQTKGIGALPKTQNDKPVLVSKSPGPLSKSPWAPLPPVDKVTPLAINPPVQSQPLSRFHPRETRAPEHISTAPSPAKEIAADDFNRSWREPQSGATRELYNSQSGRYEPVPDTRKGPSRSEQQFRAPSLLQRPAHHEQAGPAEPSPAFQTHRSSAQDVAPWARRRTSSNVSGGSGSFGRRMSLSKHDGPPKGSDLIPHRRGSQVNGVVERPLSPHRGPHGQHGISPTEPSPVNYRQVNGPPNVHYSPPSFHAGLPHPSGPQSASDGGIAPPQPPLEDPVAMQQRIMKEKRELARQRRREEEEREEAAKQERIRAKLAAMGPPPSEKRPTKETTTPAEAPKPTPATASVQSPPKPPVPEPSGEPKQYGMMKVHHPETVKKLVAAQEKASDKVFTSTGHGRQPPSPSHDAKTETAKLSTAPLTNGVRSSAEASPTESRHQHQTEETMQQWKSSLPAPGSYSTWGSQKLNSHATNSSLWGPPSNDKALGNGTFDRAFVPFSRDLASHGPLGLADQLPIGPPATNERVGGGERLPQALQSTSRGVVDSGSLPSSLPSPEKRPAHIANNDALKPIGRPGPIGPPQSLPQAQRRQPDQAPRRAPETAAWNDFHVLAAKAEAEENEKFQRELAALREEETRNGKSPSLQVTFNETWRQVRTGDQVGQRHVVGVNKTEDTNHPISPLSGFVPAVGKLPFAEDSAKPLGSTTGRGSRFFPHGSEQPRRPATQDAMYNRGPSPPPPEELSSHHPVFMGDSNKPLVHLPTPKPIVRLPPGKPSPTAPTTFASMAASAPQLRGAAQPIASTPSWQDRFNGLFGKKPAQPKTTTLAVTSSTKEPLEVPPSSSLASVSLPQYDDVDILRDAGKVTSKEVEDEEEMFEDREVGSLPVVRLPNRLLELPWQPAPPAHSRMRSKYQKPVQPMSVEPFYFGYFEKDNTGHFTMSIRLPGNAAGKTVVLPNKGGNNVAPRPRGSSSNTFKPRKNAKPRETGGSYSAPQNARKHTSTHATGARTSSPRPHSSNATWANRVSGGVTH
ncbi:hypothetical protein AJ80_01434 [Polytolypa hystricis UAMH7299]|uniref:Uncharacterized protein n=1 Tax=Polytolypa hystricis (strain UAMH7299) TaxID=1447883 RepID=A0A2B7Z0U9_POLH7|nr:hypothetical protein AJ80_01434 [Polytolypa hystricis UAMH7299]